MCKYCNQEYNDFPEKHELNGEFSGKIFDTCIDKHEDGWYMEFPNGIDVPINYCPFCGKDLQTYRRIS